MKIVIKRLIVAIFLVCALFSPSSANACAVCMGASDSNIAPAANGAIFVMFGFVGFMMACVGGLIFYLAWRAKHPKFTGELAKALAGISEEQQHA